MDIHTYQVQHSTRYDYSLPVISSHNQVYVTPRDHATQQVLKYDLLVSPQADSLSCRQDYFGNTLYFFHLPDAHQYLEITAHSTVKKLPEPAIIWDDSLSWQQARDRLQTPCPDYFEASYFCLDSPFVHCDNALREYAQHIFTPNLPLLRGVANFMQRVFEEFEYDPDHTNIVTPLNTVLADKRGVCQDFAHLMIAGLRGLGLAARYVSGYLETAPPSDSPKLQGSDASHAWLSVYVPDKAGGYWVDFDPTNNLMANQHYITTAWGRDYGDVTPVKGVVLGGGESSLTVSVDVRRG